MIIWTRAIDSAIYVLKRGEDFVLHFSLAECDSQLLIRLANHFGAIQEAHLLQLKAQERM